jgi:hypothetical protein
MLGRPQERDAAPSAGGEKVAEPASAFDEDDIPF